jgi:hypothetical protein
MPLQLLLLLLYWTVIAVVQLAVCLIKRNNNVNAASS